MVQFRASGAQILPQLRLFPQGGGRAVNNEENRGNGHHHGQVVHHVPGQLGLGPVQLLQVVAFDHQLGDPHLLIHPGDHHLFVHTLVRPSDEVAVQVNVHVVHALHRRQGLVDENVVHIESVLGQLQTAVPQQLGTVDHRVHQQVLGGPEPADLIPGEDLVLWEYIGVPHHLLGVVLHVLVDIVGDEQVHRLLHGGKLPQLVQGGGQSLLVQPVIGIHHLVVQAAGPAQALVDPLAVAAVLLVNGLDNGRIFGRVFVADGRGVVFGGAVIHQNDLYILPAGEQRVDAVIHIGRRIVAGYGKCDEL